MAEYVSTLTGSQMDSALLDMANHESEAWAVGQRNGTDVPSTDETYQNNAKYYAGHITEAGKPPYIGSNGDWYEWSSTAVAYVDTGVQAQGEAGEKAEVDATEYQASTSGTTVPTGTWSSTIPVVASGSYLWTRMTWNSTPATYSYSVARQGVDGTGGDMLKSVYSPNYTGELASNADLEEHTEDSDIHCTASQKTSWTAKADKPDMGTIDLSATWTGTASPYSQTVTVTGATVTSNSKVDIQPDSTVIAQLVEDGCNALYIANNNGTLTAYAIGEKPTVALSDIQVSVTEVTA